MNRKLNPKTSETGLTGTFVRNMGPTGGNKTNTHVPPLFLRCVQCISIITKFTCHSVGETNTLHYKLKSEYPKEYNEGNQKITMCLQITQNTLLTFSENILG